MSFKPTEEQQKIIDLALKGEDLRINAFAGASKTTTLSLIAHAKDKTASRRGMYLAFNKANAVEAQGRFPASVDCRTVHSLAYRSTPKELIAKLKLQKVFPKDLSRILGFSGSFIENNLGESKYLSIGLKTSMVNRTISYFCNSADEEVLPKHVVLMDWMYEPMGRKFDFTNLRAEILDIARKLWDATIDPATSIPMTHDAYLKLFSMNCKQLAVDYIMIDENQDSSPVILKILERQKRAQKIFVGDRYQAIYAWRGAIDAMDIVGGTEVYLTKSFRFGNNVEYLANIFLKEAGCKINLSGNGQDEGKILLNSQQVVPDAIICRKNVTVIAEIFEMANLYPDLDIGASCDVSDIERFANAYLELKAGRATDHPLLFAFGNIGELMLYCKENSEDKDISGMVNLILEFGAERIIDIVKRSAKVEHPDILITTAHKAKGLEWDNIRIANDFLYEVSGDDVAIGSEELNLIYVAVTRAKKNIDIIGIVDLISHFQEVKGSYYVEELQNKILKEASSTPVDEVAKEEDKGFRPKIFDEEPVVSTKITEIKEPTKVEGLGLELMDFE